MTRIRFWAMAAMMLAALAARPAMAAYDESPESFVHDIYAHYESRFEGDETKGIALVNAAVVHRYFEPTIAAKMIADMKASHGEVGALDFDPFVNGQDWQITGVKIAINQDSPIRALATVRFKNFDAMDEIRLQLLRVGKGWRVADILYSNEMHSLSSVYKK